MFISWTRISKYCMNVVLKFRFFKLKSSNLESKVDETARFSQKRREEITGSPVSYGVPAELGWINMALLMNIS